MTTLRHASMATLPSSPKANNTFWECPDDENKHHWIQAIFHQYSKNQMVNFCSKPKPRESVPAEKKVLTSLLTPLIKSK